MRHQIDTRLWLLTLTVLLLSACATTRTPLQIAQDTSQTLERALATLDDTERDLYTQKILTDAVHVKAAPIILKLLQAGRGYNRSVIAWTDGTGTAEAVTVARRSVLAALDDLEKVVAGQTQLATALKGVRVALGGVV